MTGRATASASSALSRDLRLDGRVAVITGGGRGIGAAVSTALCAAGAAVLVSDIDGELARRVASTLAADGLPATAQKADVTSERDVATLFSHALEWGGRLDIVVCSAGVTSTETLWDGTLIEWERVLRVNLTGSFLCAREALRLMKTQAAGGRIVFIGSGVAHQGALLGHAAYAASKAGVHALAKTMARAGAAFAITANVVAPGITDTELLRETHSAEDIAAIARTVPLGIGSPTDVGLAVAFLASDAARHITGATLDVNGGQIIR